MYKPGNYEETQAQERFDVKPGGHLLVIKKVEETTSKAGKPMWKVYYDTHKNDSQPGYFMKDFEAQQPQPGKDKWWRGTQYIVIEDENRNCTKSFKMFCTCVERSNGFTIDWNKETSQFTGRIIGGVFGDVENEYNGEVTVRSELRWFCEADKYKTQKVPKLKELPERPAPVRPAPAPASSFAPETDLPF